MSVRQSGSNCRVFVGGGVVVKYVLTVSFSRFLWIWWWCSQRGYVLSGQVRIRLMLHPDQTDAEMFWSSGQHKWCPRSSETSAGGKWNSKCGLCLPFIRMLNLTCLLILMGIKTRSVNSVMCLMDFWFRPWCGGGVTETKNKPTFWVWSFCCMNEAVLHLFTLTSSAT